MGKKQSHLKYPCRRKKRGYQLESTSSDTMTNLIEEIRKKNFMCEEKGLISDNIAKQVFHKEEAKSYLYTEEPCRNKEGWRES